MVIYLPTLHLRTLGNEIELEFGNVDFFGDGKTGEPGKNPLGARREPTTNSTVPKYEAGSGNRTQATLVGGERSHQCATPASHVQLFVFRCVKLHFGFSV